MPDTTNTPQFVEDNAIVVPESKFNPLVEAGKKLISELIILSKATTEPTTEELKVITKGRNSLKTIRCDIENARVDLKKDIIKKERLIDSLAREYTKPIQELEEKLKEREKYKENMEAKRKQELARSRAELLLPYIDALRMVDYKLGEMAPEVFDGLLIGLKAKREAQLAEQARIEAERQAKAEADRIEQERIRAENEKLKQEAEEKRKQYEAELDKARIAREAQEEAARIEAQRIAEERRKEKEIADAKEKVEREAREKAEAEAQALRDAEAARQAEEARIVAQEAESARKAASAPDKQKLLEYADQMNSVQPPSMATEDGARVLLWLTDKWTVIYNELAGKVEEL